MRAQVVGCRRILRIREVAVADLKGFIDSLLTTEHDRRAFRFALKRHSNVNSF